MAESCRRLLEMLPTQELRNVAVWKMEGYTNEEIAAKMKSGQGRSLATVERKLRAIRENGRGSADASLRLNVRLNHVGNVPLAPVTTMNHE